MIDEEKKYKWCRLFGSDEQFHDDIDDVIQEYLNDNDLEEDEAKDIEIEIEFGEEDENFKWDMGILEDLLERLDQELGTDDWTQPTDAMKEAEKNLIEVVKKEYPVRPVKECGVKTIRIGDYL